MKNSNFIDPSIASLFASHGLDDFSALWELELEAVDQPNTERGGWSSVSFLDLEGHEFYLKRQSNHLTRSLYSPLGEPTFAREFRTICQFRQRGIPALKAAWFGQRKVGGEQRAILVTHALTGWQDLAWWLEQWPQLGVDMRAAIVKACGRLARTLHAAGQVHGCFYPKHIFLRQQHGFEACLIDLEKTRRIRLNRRDRIKDLEPLVRRTQHVWSEVEYRLLLESALEGGESVLSWYDELQKRNKSSDNRKKSAAV